MLTGDFQGKCVIIQIQAYNLAHLSAHFKIKA